jgi:hypothetical protein
MGLTTGLGISVGFSSCADDDKLAQVDPSHQKVQFWHQHDGERRASLQQLIDEFNRTNAHDIEIVAEYAGEYREIYSRMPGAASAGSGPQMVVAYSNQAHPYYLSDWVVDLGPYMRSDKWGLGSSRADYFDAFLQQDNVGGVQVARRTDRWRSSTATPTG